MEIKSKFNEGDLVFTKNSDKKTVTAFFICSIDSYRQQDGFVYKCVRADFLEMYKIDNKKINDIKPESFDYIRESYLYRDQYDYMEQESRIALEIERQIINSNEVHYLYNLFSGKTSPKDRVI